MSGFTRKTTALIALTLMGLVLSGCGRHGPLEAPEGSKSPVNVKPSDSEDGADPSVMAFPGADGQEQKKATKKIDRPKRPFILDPIL
jgi:predicted small lipoprotein YifL